MFVCSWLENVETYVTVSGNSMVGITVILNGYCRQGFQLTKYYEGDSDGVGANNKLACFIKLNLQDCFTKQPIFLSNGEVIWQACNSF